MAYLNIPVKNAADLGAFYFSVDLEGATYELHFQRNAREGFWYVDLWRDGERVRSGVKIVINWPLFLRCKESKRAPGQFLFVDTRTPPGQPNFDELGVAAKLIYCESSSLPE